MLKGIVWYRTIFNIETVLYEIETELYEIELLWYLTVCKHKLYLY